VLSIDVSGPANTSTRELTVRMHLEGPGDSVRVFSQPEPFDFERPRRCVVTFKDGQLGSGELDVSALTTDGKMLRACAPMRVAEGQNTAAVQLGEGAPGCRGGAGSGGAGSGGAGSGGAGTGGAGMGGAGAGGAGMGGAGSGGAGMGGAGAGGAGAGGAGSGGAAFAGCTTFDDRTVGPTNTRTVRTLATRTYSPKCMRVRVGQSAVIEASTMYPLAPAPQSGNPVPAGTTNQTFQLTQAGVFGYYCTTLGTSTGTGMAGAIEVVP